MSIFNMFNKQPAASQPAPQPSTTPAPAVPTANPQYNGMMDGAGDSNKPAGGEPQGQTGNAQTPPNPLDAFATMFDNKPDADNEKAPVFSLPADILEQVARGQNFTSGMDEALMEKALSGDAKALMQVINAASQNAYQASLSHMTGLSDKYVNSRLEFEGKSLGSKVKEHLTSAELQNTPSFNHPVVKAQLISVSKDLAKQHPDASPQEIASMAKNYITTLANAINPQEGQEASTNRKAASTNWDTFFDQ